VIAVHAERVSGEPSAVRWAVRPAGVPRGRVLAAPGELGRMFGDGTLTAGLVEDTAVWLWLGDGLSWRTHGPAIQAALREALLSPGQWVVEPAAGEVLERITADVLAGSVGDFVRSHDGSVAAERDGDTVTVKLGGACEHCPASGQTLRHRLVSELRRRCPDLVELDSRSGQLRLQLHAPGAGR
jgi:Fe-S cluster biogenesis protein NfuA